MHQNYWNITNLALRDLNIIFLTKKLQNKIQERTCNNQGLEIDDDDLPWLPVATPLETARKYSTPQCALHGTWRSDFVFEARKFLTEESE